MSRKDYIAIADILSRKLNGSSIPLVRETVREIAVEMADTFKTDNPNFDRNKFFDAINFPNGRFTF